MDEELQLVDVGHSQLSFEEILKPRRDSLVRICGRIGDVFSIRKEPKNPLGETEH